MRVAILYSLYWEQKGVKNNDIITRKGNHRITFVFFYIIKCFLFLALYHVQETH